jgi:5'-methylthioadenosine phosphorylase
MFADPVCPSASAVLEEAARAGGLSVRRGGTYVCMEGPQFSTRAESRLYRSWGADVIGMTNLTEARLAREAEICYASLGLVTDYDAWREATEPVAVDTILAVMRENSAAAGKALREAAIRMDPGRTCGCRDAMRNALITDPGAISEETKNMLRPIVGRYL